MNRIYVLIALSLLVSCSTTKYYVVRHAEKEPATTMTTDVLLTDAGKQRALSLASKLNNKKIQHIYSTNFARTRATAQPLSIKTGVAIENYTPGDASFIKKLKELPKGNVLIVGHSNTVDDIVNGLTGKADLKDLDEAAYGDLFIVKKKGTKYILSQEHFGN
ncbi:MAG TPA: histidine phosphatase family protein [Chitinophagaceae bacterium]|nr:histidine phosphatase family protein [Chitinophagaceae bacterium]